MSEKTWGAFEACSAGAAPPHALIVSAASRITANKNIRLEFFTLASVWFWIGLNYIYIVAGRFQKLWVKNKKCLSRLQGRGARLKSNLRLRNGMDPLKLCHILRGNIRVMDHNHILVIGVLSAGSEIIGAHHHDLTVNDHDFVMHLTGIPIQMNIQSRGTERIIFSPNIG